VTGVAGIATFDLSSTVLSAAGTYSIAVTSPGLTGAIASLIVTAPVPTATTTVLSAPTTSLVETTVTISAAVTGVAGTPTPTGQVSFLDGSTVLGSGTLSSSDVATFTTTSLTVGLHSLTANYAGDANNAPSQIVTLTVMGAPDFSIALTPANVKAAIGSSAASSVSITPLNGFASAVTFSCSGLPSFASCTFNPNALTPSGSVATSTVTIATNVQTAGIRFGARPGDNRRQLASTSSLAILLLPLLGFRRKRETSRLRVFGSIVVALLLFQGIFGCSGSSSSSKAPRGPYSVSITATSGSLRHSAILTLAVQ